MSIPREIEEIIHRLSLELDRIEEIGQEGLGLLRSILETFPDNELLIQFYGYLNNALFFVGIYRRRIQMLVEILSEENVPEATIENVARGLGDLLGRAIESRVGVEQIVDRIKKLS